MNILTHRAAAGRLRIAGYHVALPSHGHVARAGANGYRCVLSNRMT
jgi:hypothetical protein